MFRLHLNIFLLAIAGLLTPSVVAGGESIAPQNVKAFQKAGAYKIGNGRFCAGLVSTDIPMFRFSDTPKADVPQVAVPFGLELQEKADRLAYITRNTDDLKPFIHLENIQALRINGQLGEGLELFRDILRFKQLKHLEISSTRISLAQLRILAEIKTLESLDLAGHTISDRGISLLGSLPNLRQLAIQGSDRITGAGLNGSRGFKRVSQLILGDGITDEGLEAVALLPKLDTLLVRSNDDVETFTAKGLATLSKVSTLRRLDIYNENLGDRDFQILGGMTQLHYLGIGATSDQQLEEITKLRNLRHLNIHSGTFTAKSFPKIFSLSQLETLHLPVCDKLTAAAFRGIGALDRLQSLNLIYSPISDQAIHEIGKLKNLRELRLFRSKISDQSVSSLAKMQSLRYLSIDIDNLSQQALEKLVRSLPDCDVIH